jgi:hypothetical protein
MHRILVGGSLIFAFLGVVLAQQSVPMSPVHAPNAVTPQAPQKHQPPAQPQPASGIPRTAPQPLTNIHVPYVGTIEGFVYWDASLISHKPASSCDGLSVTVSLGSRLGGSGMEQFKPLNTLSNNFKYVGGVGTYAVCTYAFDHVPVGQDMQVQIGVSTPLAFSPVSAPAVAITGPIKIINGKCNNLPAAVPSSSELSAHWWTCGNHAYNVNFTVQPSAHIMSAGSGSSGTGLLSGSSSKQAGMLSGTSQQGMLQTGAPGNQPPATRAVQGNTSASKVELNPQPLPPGGKTSMLQTQSAGGSNPSVSACEDSCVSGCTKAGGSQCGKRCAQRCRQTSLTNADVIKMVKAGLPESVIISSFQSGEKKFDLSPVGCRTLNAAHVSENLLNAMGDGSVRPCATVGNASANTPGSNVELNPQPWPPRTAAGATPSAAAGTAENEGKRVEQLDPKFALKLGPANTGTEVKNPRIAERVTKTVAILQKQRSAADVEAGQMKLSLRAPVQSGMLMGPSQTMSAGTGGAVSPTAQAPSALAMNNGIVAGSGGTGKISPAITHVPNVNTTVLTCTNDPAFRILHVSGSSFPATFTPIDQYNLYTITGCSFGDPSPNNKVYVYGTGSFQGNFNIKFWSENSIALSLDPTISGYPDLDNLTLVIQRSDGQQAQKGGFKFYAARATVPLNTIPSSWVKFATFTYGFKTMSAQYSSPPSSDPGPGASGGAAYVSRFFNGQKFDPTGQYDVYNFGQLAPGWTTDSFQLNTYDQYCPYVITYRHTFGMFKGMWDSRGNIVVWLSDTSCSGFNPISPFLIQNYQNWTGSYYALQVWVNGPRGTDPFTDQRAQ